MIAFIFWAIVGITLNIIVALKKGRDVIVWLILGAVFGFLSTLVLALLPRSTDSGAYKKCPNCAELILSEAKACRYCTKEITLLPLGERSLDQTAIEKDHKVQSEIA